MIEEVGGFTKKIATEIPLLSYTPGHTSIRKQLSFDFSSYLLHLVSNLQL